jgi:RNA polymerase sigma-70 factor (ECF subfamily)
VPDTTESLLAAFHSALDGAKVSSQPRELAGVLQLSIDVARSAWPQLEISAHDFAYFLAERHNSNAFTPNEPLRNAADLWLACACIRAVPLAHESFHAVYAPIITRVLVRRGASDSQLQDLVHNVLEKLLLPRDAKPALLVDYTGSGSLKSWVSTVAVTTLLMSRRTSERRREDLCGDDALEARLAEDGGELQFLKRHYRKPVENAISAALTQLGDRERVLLRLHLVERMSIDRLGTMYNVNRATAARWLANARAAVLRATRAEMRRELRVSESECDSIIKLVDSQLQVSVARHL